MNASIIHIVRNRLPLFASTVLIALGVTLLASALIAQDRSNKPTATHIPNCLVDNWPPTDPDKKWLIEAFEKALHDSAMSSSDGSALRSALLDTTSNFKSPRDAIEKILKKAHPDTKIKFPKDLVVIFYEEETEKTATPTAVEQTKAVRTGYVHPNHCYLVLYLEPAGSITAASPNPNFQDHVKCCYDPY